MARAAARAVAGLEAARAVEVMARAVAGSEAAEAGAKARGGGGTAAMVASLSAREETL